MNLPEWYIEWVTRVSAIVNFKYPFKGTPTETIYLNWLADNVNPKHKRGFAINPQEYMDEACDIWTFIHLQMEKHILGKRTQKSNKLYKAHIDEINWGIEYINKLKEEYPNAIWKPEQVVIDGKNRYQWTIDLVRIDETNKTVYLYDWKTFGIAKKKWNLPNKYKKPTSKLIKLALQLSLYAEIYKQKGYKIGGIYGIYLHETGCYEYKLKQWTTKQIDNLLKAFYADTDKTIEINYITDMIITMRKPTVQYGYVEITIDMYKETEWATAKDKVAEAKDLFAYITNEKNKKWTK